MRYPQLSSGALAQYGVRRGRRAGISRVELAGGAVVQGPPSDAQWVEWDFAYRGLNCGEAGAIRDLFDSCQGKLGSFWFVDPMANLLRDTENLTGDGWETDAGVLVNALAWDGDLRGQVHSVSNGDDSVAGVWQTLQIDRGYQYALSCYARGGTVTLSAIGLGPQVSVAESAGAVWRRLWLPVRLEEEGLGLTCGFCVEPGASVEVCGLQLEAQAAPGGYKASSLSGAIFSDARFGMDELTMVAEDEGSFRADVKIYCGI